MCFHGLAVFAATWREAGTSQCPVPSKQQQNSPDFGTLLAAMPGMLSSHAYAALGRPYAALGSGEGIIVIRRGFAMMRVITMTSRLAEHQE